MQSRGFGKEALVKLQALGLINDLYVGDVLNPGKEKLKEFQTNLEQIQAIPRPKLQ